MPLNPDVITLLRTGEMIPISSLDFATSRSGGPGGQNVNKVETKVEVRMQIENSSWLSPETQQTLLAKLASKIDSTGTLRVTSSTELTQLGNRNAVVERLERILNAALVPEKHRVPTKPSRASKQRRVDTKKRQSEKKSSRKWRPGEG